MRPKSRSLADERNIICTLKKKNAFMAVQQVKNALQVVGGHVSQSMIKRQLHEQNLSGFTTRSKPPGELKKQKEQAAVHKNTFTQKKRPIEFCGKVMKQKSTLSRAEDQCCDGITPPAAAAAVIVLTFLTNPVFVFTSAIYHSRELYCT